MKSEPSVQATPRQGPQGITAVYDSETSKSFTAGSAEQAEDSQSAYSIEDGGPQSKDPLNTSSVHIALENSQQNMQTVSCKDGTALAVPAPNQGVIDGATAHDGSGGASGHASLHGDGRQHQQSVQSVSSEEALSMGMQWLQSVYRGPGSQEPGAARCARQPARCEEPAARYAGEPQLHISFEVFITRADCAHTKGYRQCFGGKD